MLDYLLRVLDGLNYIFLHETYALEYIRQLLPVLLGPPTADWVIAD